MSVVHGLKKHGKGHGVAAGEVGGKAGGSALTGGQKHTLALQGLAIHNR